MTSFLRELKDDDIAYDDQNVLMTRAAFLGLDDYTRSRPTGPSVGRIWRRSMQWSSKDSPNWFVYVVWADEAGESWTTGRKVFLTDADVDEVPSGWGGAK